MYEKNEAARLFPLLRMNRDFAVALESAGNTIVDEPAREMVKAFGRDHARHAADVTAMIRLMGAEPPARGNEEHSVEELLEAEQARSLEKTVRSLSRLEAASLVAYGRILSESTGVFPPDVQVLLEIHYREEERHAAALADLEQRLVAAGVPG